MAKPFLKSLNDAFITPRNSVLPVPDGPIRLTDGNFWSALFGMRSASGKNVNIDNAMQLSAVWACVRLLSETIASLPLKVYRENPDGSREVARDHYLSRILGNSPNAQMTSMQFKGALSSSMLLRGNAYAHIHRSRGEIVSLEFLLPNRIQVEQADNGSLLYYYSPPAGNQSQILGANMLHVPAFSLDGLMGLSPIAYGANVFGSAISADEAAGSVFKNGLMPTTAFSTERILKPEQREEFRKYVEELSGAMNAGKSPVLEAGVKAESIGIDPQDAQVLESRGYGVEEVCRWFGVDPSMVGHGNKDSNWGTGLEQKQIAFLTYTLRPWLTRIEQAINKHLITPEDRRTMYVEFSIEGLLRADSKARSEFYSSASQNGWMTRNEIRRKENLPERDGGDQLTAQTNLAPLDQLGKPDP